MLYNRKELKRASLGFTLIELLVVVLIIGILAAIALPQYQLAVDRSNLTKHLSMLKAIKNAQEMYFLMHGHYVNSWEQLDLGALPAGATTQNTTISWGDAQSHQTQIITLADGWRYELQSGGGYTYISRGYSVNADYISFGYILNNLTSGSNNTNICISSTSSARQNKLCKSFGGVVYQTNADVTYYKI
jgi:type II secretion system protein G